MDSEDGETFRRGVFVYTVGINSRVPKMFHLNREIDPTFRFALKRPYHIHITPHLKTNYPGSESGILSPEEFREYLGNYFSPNYIDLHSFLFTFTIGTFFEGPEASALPEKNFCNDYYEGLFKKMLSHANYLIELKAYKITEGRKLTISLEKGFFFNVAEYNKSVKEKLIKTEMFLVIFNRLCTRSMISFMHDFRCQSSPYNFRFIQISNHVKINSE